MFMLEMGIHFCFTQEALTCRGIMHQVGADNLDGYFAVKCCALVSQVYLSHSTNVNTTDQVIVSKTKLTLSLGT